MTKINVLKKPKLNNPILIEGLPGVGNIGRVAAGYLVETLKAEKFADLYSEHFFPFVMLHDNYQVHMLKNEFYYYKAKKASERDLIFLVGDCQSISPHGHYLVSEMILDFVSKFGCKEIYTIGGIATGEFDEEPKTIAAVTHKELMTKHKKLPIDFDAGKKVGYIVGAAGLLLGLGKERGMKGMCLLGETSGFPIVTDPKAAEMVLDTLTNILKVKVDMSKLESKVKEMEKFIKKVETLQRKALTQITKEAEKGATGGKAGDQLRYIG
jgi:uncharacterized protein (TIGR00162 family)